MDTTEDTVHNRTYYVLDRMLKLIPDEAKEHPMAQMLTFFIREGKKDIRRIPEEFILNLSGQIGEAFMWVAQGSMNDLIETDTETGCIHNEETMGDGVTLCYVCNPDLVRNHE